MRIAFISELYPAGKSPSVYHLELTARELRKLGHKVIILAPGKQGRERNIRRISALSHSSISPYHFALPSQLDIDYLARQKLDLIHTFHMFKMGWFGVRAGRALNLPVVFTYHTLLNEYINYLPLSKRQYFSQKIVKYLDQHTVDYCKNINELIALSGSAKSHLRQLGVKSPIRLLPPPVNVKNFSRAGARILKKKLNITDKNKVILYVGRIDRNKNIDFLLAVFNRIAKKIESVVLIIVGEGEGLDYYKKLTSHSTAKGRIFWQGFVSRKEIAKYYQLADLFIYPASLSSRGNSILEAFASHVPIIATSSSASRHLIENGKNGFVLPAKEHLFSATALQILNDRRLSMRLAKNGYIVAKQNDLAKRTRKLVKIYQEVILLFTKRGQKR